jgi:UDP-N-acetylmuramyl tripeptide synthase
VGPVRDVRRTPAKPVTPARRSPRLVAAVATARVAGAVCRMARRGGTSLPGLAALRVQPQAVRLLAGQLGCGSLVVAGTNGKTTTCAWIAAALEAGGRPVVRNGAGSNMMRGVATSLLRKSTLGGHLRHGRERCGLFEADEAALPAILAQVQPRFITLTNLFRDQLDRYGEIATTAARWRESLAHLPSATVLLLNADDPLVAGLADAAPGRVVFYGVQRWPEGQSGQSGQSGVGPILARSADSLYCPRCTAPLTFTSLSYAHLGQYHCTACGYERPQPDFWAEVAEADGAGCQMLVQGDGQTASCFVPLPGRYNVYNALAALATAVVAGSGLQVAATAVAAAKGAFGRAEVMTIGGRDLSLYLIKNPTGADEVFRVVRPAAGEATLLLLLSDHAADSEDVSWIWDAQLDLLLPWPGPVVCGGTRAEDMALRLKYAGLGRQPIVVPRDVPRAVRQALASATAGPVVVLATYTAMLAARSYVARAGGGRQYWQAQA